MHKTRRVFKEMSFRWRWLEWYAAKWQWWSKGYVDTKLHPSKIKCL